MGTGPLLGLLWVLSALVTPGDFLLCKECTSTSAELCNGSSLVCPDSFACTSSHTVFNTHQSIFDMSCAPKHHCDAPGSMSASNGRIRRSTTCCYTDNCTPPHPISVFLSCKECTSTSDEFCNAYSGVCPEGFTTTICNIGNQSVITDRNSAEVQISCAGGAVCLHLDSFLYTYIVLTLLTLSTMS